MRTILTCAAALSMAAFAWGVQPAASAAKKKALVKKAAVKSAARKPAAPSKTGAALHTASAKKSAKKVPVKRTTWRNRQATPSSDRYLEIQNALVAKGCLPAGAATGAWDQASADALKKFQSEQNIDSNGKINSLSLIALGLGPRHDSNSTKTAEGGNNYPPDPTGR
jgi:D-alanyl-D-alanine carboxypeptidase